MYVIENKSLPQSGLPGLGHTTLAGCENGLRYLSVWRQTIEPGAGTLPHWHECEEVVLIDSGHGELHITGAVHAFAPDMTLVIPPNLDHQIVNPGSEAINLVGLFSMSPVKVVFPDGRPIPLPWKSCRVEL